MDGVGELIERDDELAVLGEVIADAIAGGGGAVLVEGEAGIGKTRLLAPVRAHAAASGARVLFATADEGDATVPLAGARVLLGRAARGIGPDGPARLGVLALQGALADAGELGSRADEVVHALWWLVVELAEDQPLVLMVDDAQWADDVTLGLLRMIARRAGELPLALIVAARPAAPGARHALLATERAFVRLEPAALSVAGTAKLLEQVLGRPEADSTAERARAITGGNPLYLSELGRAGAAVSDVLAGGRPPPQLVRLIRDRLERLSPSAAALARAVAVLGADADARRARALAELDAVQARRAEEELRGERVIDAYAFAHPLVARAVREGIDTVLAADLHARAATLLAGEGVDELRVAEHLRLTLPRGDETVVATLRRAAEAARRVGGLATAAQLLERALDEPPPAGARRHDRVRARARVARRRQARRGDGARRPRAPWGGGVRPRARRAAPRAVPGAGRP